MFGGNKGMLGLSILAGSVIALIGCAICAAISDGCAEEPILETAGESYEPEIEDSLAEAEEAFCDTADAEEDRSEA